MGTAVLPQIWSVFGRDTRLVLALSDQPGIYNFARFPDEDVEILECPFATIQCYDSRAESRLLDLLFASPSLEVFLGRLRRAGFWVTSGRPVVGRIARL